MICPCGKPIETTSADPFVLIQYDKESIVYAVCQHRVVVVDNRPKPAPQIDASFLFAQKETHANYL